MLQIKTNSIKAAVTMAATKDARYYLKGVEISVREVGGDVQSLNLTKCFEGN